MTSPLPIATAAAGRRTIPFDYTFQFKLTGTPDRTHQQSIQVSVEAAFTALSIGYGLIPKFDAVPFGPEFVIPLTTIALTASPTFNSITMGDLLRGAATALGASPLTVSLAADSRTPFREGFRVNPAFLSLALDAPQAPLSADVVGQLFQLTSIPEPDVRFLYAIFDQGTGRAFQNEPVLNTAGLGSSNGERPFRHFATPIVFSPLTTIRIDVTEVMEFAGDLRLSLHGYKTLGEPGTPTAAGRRRRTRR
jgi:hypothetical protein